jgi:hypothetical protein
MTKTTATFDFTQDVFDAKLTIFLEGIQVKINKHFEQFTNLSPNVISVTEGQRYLRIVSTDSHGTARSCWGFIDKNNGDVLKAASWKAPAKHSRGNIFTPEFAIANCGPNGPNYLR